jgi:outer membrane protein TolC
LLTRRPDIAEAEAKLTAADLSVQAARAAFMPQFTLTGAFSLQTMAIKNLFRPEAIAYSLAGQIVQPLLDGHNLQGQFELQKSKYIELLMLYRKQVLTAFSDVENAMIAARLSARREALLAAAVAASRRAYQASMQRLREGTIDIVTLSTVQSNLFQSQDALAQARQARLQAVVSLYQALGGGWSVADFDSANADETFAANDVKSPAP